ncbi:hypothetical protein QYE76_003312 [Lolium multiflorum]|jgi:hypothetical protein|uniref:RING-type domain-containing protein n=1 Tax=Lolium multiflorum TaxID=4521 RepID=A0AAD8VZ45_LOLMU|nr:hypothetical protein QYE76_003312 [Lolium multiflorum]
MRTNLLHATVSIAAAPAPGTSAAAGGVHGQLGYGVAIAVGVLVLVSTVMLASYVCFRAKARAAVALRRLVDADAHESSAVVLVAGLDGATIDALYPKFFLREGKSSGADAPCAICLGEFDAAAALRRGPGCAHCFHAGCAERWLRVSATCPVCRDSPLPSPATTPLAEAVPLAAHAR